MYKKIIRGAAVALLSCTAMLAQAADLPHKTVAEVYAQKTELAGKRIVITGKVVKVNNGIMGKNFLHIQDGTGTGDASDLTVTSQQTANMGDKIEVEALVTVGRDFGMGYSYDIILEEATIKPAK